MGTCRWCGRWLSEIPFVQVSMTWALTCTATVHQRPCMTREIETWLLDSRVGNSSVVDHRSWQPVHSPLCNCVDRCHVWPYWVSRCKPRRWMLKDISTHRPYINTNMYNVTAANSLSTFHLLLKRFYSSNHYLLTLLDWWSLQWLCQLGYSLKFSLTDWQCQFLDGISNC